MRVILMCILLASAGLNENQPTEPPKATEVSDPSDSSGPSDSSDPSDPSDSSAPSAPSAPSDLSDPSDPSDLSDSGTAALHIPPRPDWVESGVNRDGDVHTTAVSSGPQETERDGRRELDRERKRAVDDYVDWYFGRQAEDRFPISRVLDEEIAALRERLLETSQFHHEVVEFSFGPMHQVHGLIEFGPEIHAELDALRGRVVRYRQEWQVVNRVTVTAWAWGAVLVLLAVVHGYFRADLMTHGRQRRRLQWFAAAGIACLVAAAAVLLLFSIRAG